MGNLNHQLHPARRIENEAFSLSDGQMSNWIGAALILVAVTSLIAYTALRRLEKRANVKIPHWKRIAIVLVFAASVAPYALIALFTGIEDLVYFFLIWIFFYVMRCRLPPELSFIVPLVCGIMLAFPATTFLYVGHGSIFLTLDPAAEVSISTIERLIYFPIVMMATHYLLKSIQSEKAT